MGARRAARGAKTPQRETADGGIGSALWKAHNEVVVRTMDSYDMGDNPDESYYTRQYLHWILPELARRFPGDDVEILDVGCGQGRLSLPLAQWCASGRGRVRGVDLTPSAVEKACRRAAARGLSNVSFHAADALTFVSRLPPQSVHAGLLIEVTFFMPTYREVLRELARVLRPGGVAFVAFRPQHYNLLQTVQGWRWDSARMVLERREGCLWGEPVVFTWQTPDDVRALVDGVGLRLLSLRGIGVCSGLENDPLGSVMRPSRLSPQEQEQLMAIECAAAEAYAACGRYILATAEKPGRSKVGRNDVALPAADFTLTGRGLP